MSKTLVISGHPDLDSSHTNKVILDELQWSSKSDIEIRRLDSLYPDYQIDTEAEQAALMMADIIVLQFPYYWYSVPALLKKWLDDVFAFNFAYGPEGDKLKNKHFILSFTVGGPDESYGPLGYNHFTIEQFMYPLQQTAYLANMQYQPPVYSHHMVYIPGVYNKLEDVEARATEHAKRLIDKIDLLSNSTRLKFEGFVRNWFSRLDNLPTDNSEFVKHLSDDLVLEPMDETYRGVAGFNDWYQSLLSTFKPGVKHLIEQVSLKSTDDDQFDGEIRVRVQRELTNDESIIQLLNENWRVSIDAQGNFTIHKYLIQAV